MIVSKAEIAILRLLVVVLAIVAGALGWYVMRGQALFGDGTTQRSSSEVEAIIDQYLKDNPEIVVNAVRDAQAKAEKAKAEQAETNLTELKATIFDNPADPVLGNPGADMAVVEFFDYRCPYCKRVVPDIDALVLEDAKLRVVLKEYPILGPESVYAAKMALASARQDKYLEMHKALMAHRGDFGEVALIELARGLGLDTARLKTDMQDPAIAGQIQANLDLGRSLGVNGTPAFIIGRKIVPGAISKEEMKSLVKEARSASE